MKNCGVPLLGLGLTLVIFFLDINTVLSFVTVLHDIPG